MMCTQAIFMLQYFAGAVRIAKARARMSTKQIRVRAAYPWELRT